MRAAPMADRAVAPGMARGLLLAGACLVMVSPFLWMGLTSLMGQLEVFSGGSILPQAPRWSNYPEALTAQPFARYFLNSLVFATAVAAGQVATSATAGYAFALFAIAELAPGFQASYPWYRGALWMVIGTQGMIGSALIGHHEGSRNADHATARSAGLRVFAFWMAVIIAAFLISAAAGLWTADRAENIPHVAIGIVCLGYVLFGIMHRPALAVVGVGMAAAFYMPAYFAGDFAALGTGAGMLAVTVFGAAWIHKSGQA